MKIFLVTINGDESITPQQIQNAVWNEIDGAFGLQVVELSGVKTVGNAK